MNMCFHFAGGAFRALQPLHSQPSAMQSSTRVDIFGKFLIPVTVSVKIFVFDKFSHLHVLV